MEKGRGYVPASEQYSTTEDQEIGLIPVDAIKPANRSHALPVHQHRAELPQYETEHEGGRGQDRGP